MYKRIGLFFAVVLVTFCVAYFLHNYILQSQQLTLNYSLLLVYLFFVVSSLFVYVVIEVLASIIPKQVGFAYLASIFLKIGFFVLVFKSSFFLQDNLEMYQKLSVVIPLFLFLTIEGTGIARLLNRL